MKTVIGSLVLATAFVACGGSTEEVGGTPSTPADGTGGAVSGGASSGASAAGPSAGTNGPGESNAGGAAVCTLPKKPGSCRGWFERWWFNAATGKCEHFIYGGCDGNANNFESIAACIAGCASTTGNICDHVTCSDGQKCVFLDGTATCATPCASGGPTCPSPNQTCRCGSSCPNCKDCAQVCSSS